jgi:hypothetical protein
LGNHLLGGFRSSGAISAGAGGSQVELSDGSVISVMSVTSD